LAKVTLEGEEGVIFPGKEVYFGGLAQALNPSFFIIIKAIIIATTTARPIPP
jgi:hypothetical protein